VIALTVAQVHEVTGGRLVGVDPNLVLDGPVVADSRAVQPGSVFVALPGARVDGHDFAPAAVAAGARLVLAERELVDASGQGLPTLVVPDVPAALGALAAAVLDRLRQAGAEPGGTAPTVIAITGSVGKTSTKDLLAQVCATAGPTVAPERSFNNEIGLPLTVLRADESTRFLVLEMGASAPGDLTYLTSLAPPDVAVVLVVGNAHLGGFGGGLDQVAAAKSELVVGLLPGGVAVLNSDDQRVAAMATLAPGPVVRFGLGVDADVRAVDLRLDRTGRASFTLEVAGPDRQPASAPVTLRLVGEHQVHNALAAAGAALAAGLPVAEVAAGLSAAGALSPHRMNVIDRPDGVTVVDDAYNANPDSMRAALKALAVLARPDRRSVAVLGEMLELGEHSREAHDSIGRLVVRLDVGLTVVVGAGARAIADGAAHEGSWGDEVVIVDDIEQAAQLLETELRPGDVVLVKSSLGAGLWQLSDRLVGTAS
jgi:UDP-N-acetylmuramoyl-tripeptide--D-alanyl-D-alanine ligase